MTAMRAALSTLLLLASAASAQTIYKWTDARGTVHYTDDPSTVPARVKVTTTEGDELSNTGSVVKIEPAPAATPPPATAPSGTAASKEEEYWREQFRAARDKIRTLEDELALDQRKQEDRTLPVTGSYFTPNGYGYGGYRPYGYGATVTEQVSVAGSLNLPLGNVGNLTVNGNATSSAVVPYAGYGGYPRHVYAYEAESSRTRDRIERTRLALTRAKEELADLERRAAFNSVPLEWRH